MSTFTDMVADISWSAVGRTIASDLWWLTKILTALAVGLATVVLGITFAIVVVLLTGRFPWFVRRWL